MTEYKDSVDGILFSIDSMLKEDGLATGYQLTVLRALKYLIGKEKFRI